MSRADCDICDEYREKEAKELRIYRESSESANRIIEKQLHEIESWQVACQEKDKQIADQDVRIKELEAALIDSRALYLLLLDVCPEAPGWNLDDQDSDTKDRIRKRACESLAMEEPLILLQLREQMALIEKLEAAYLQAKQSLIWEEIDRDQLNLHYKDVKAPWTSWMSSREKGELARAKARAALEKIKQGDRKL